MKMKVKMTIFVQARTWFDFSEMIVFWFIFNFIFQKWFKNEVENEPKMSQKWLLRTTLFFTLLDHYFGGHSLRAGGATYFASPGLSEDVIQPLGH